MSDAFYRVVKHVGKFAFWVSSRPVVMGLEHVPRRGACIIAATHESPFDVPLIIRHTPRLLDIVSIVEVFRKPVLGWFYGSLNAFPLDRSRADPATVRVVLERLERGRVVAMFPEGAIRNGGAGAVPVVRGGKLKKGVGRIAKIAGAPIVPCVVVNSGAYARVGSWLPLRRVRYGVMYGEPISAGLEAEEMEERLARAMVEMYGVLVGRMGE